MKREIGVTLVRHGATGEALRFAETGRADGTAPLPYEVPVTSQTLSAQLQSVHSVVSQLSLHADGGKPRGGVAVEPALAQLARLTLPEGSTGSLLDPGDDVVFDAEERLLGIPFELLEETHWVCPVGAHVRKSAEGAYCPQHGKPLTCERGKLGVKREVWFNVRGACLPPAKGGRRFLMILDPQEDLLMAAPGASTELVERAAQAERSHEQLLELLQGQFEPLILRGPNASHERVMQALRRTDVAGVYYFGHAFLADGEDGWLQLADRRLTSREIMEANPSVRMVFLNACWGAGASTWQLDGGRHLPVAYAFARGHKKSVIGSLWALEKVQASRAALTFFRQVLQDHRGVGGAMRAVRTESYERYRHDEADLGWMSYRLLGSPSDLTPGAADELFRSGALNMEAFAFEVGEVLKRALRCRNRTNRVHVLIEDLMAGLLRCGDLTRLMMRCVATDPDALYLKLCLRYHPDNRVNHDALRTFDERDRGQLGREVDLHPDLQRLLLAAHAAAHREDQRITELHLIEQLLPSLAGGRTWLRLKQHLPDAGECHTRLNKVLGTLVDHNGCFNLARLAFDARQVVEVAHRLAQERGVLPIPSALILAAFLGQPSGLVARVWARTTQQPVSRVRLRLIAELEAKTQRNFALSLDACDGWVRPMVERAVVLANSERGLVTERHLFPAFVSVAKDHPPGSMTQLAARAGFVDLEELAQAVVLEGLESRDAGPNLDAVAPEDGLEMVGGLRQHLDSRGQQLIQHAVEHARRSGTLQVSAPHLCVALIGDGETEFGRVLQARGLDPQACKHELLGLVQRQTTRADPVELTPHATAILRCALECAKIRGLGTIGPEEVFIALQQDLRTPPEYGHQLGKLLRRIGAVDPLGGA